jgi:hypothetical protein
VSLCLAAGLLFAQAQDARAAIAITVAGQTYLQDFDSLTLSTWANDATLPGWSLFSQPAPGSAVTSLRINNGGGNTSSFYSYVSIGGSDHALGALVATGTYFGAPAEGEVAGWIAAQFTNDSGGALGGFSLGFDGEQWRNGGNPAAQTMVFEYGYGSRFADVTDWIAPGGLFDWATVVNGTTLATDIGNGAGLVANRGGTVSTPWNAGDTLWLRWRDVNDPGNDHGMAIDNLSFVAGPAVTTPSAVPLPGPAALLAIGLAALGIRPRRPAAALPDRASARPAPMDLS